MEIIAVSRYLSLKGRVIIQHKGCWNADVKCNRTKCVNAYNSNIYFCCCIGHNCNNEVLLADGLPRPHATVIMNHEYVKGNGTFVGPAGADERVARPAAATEVATDDAEPSPDKVAAAVFPTSSGSGAFDPTSRASQEPMPTLTLVLVIFIILICVVLSGVGAVVGIRFFRQQMLHGKKVPFDPENALVMAPLMSKEYENQDGCALLKNLVLQERKATGRYGEVWKGRLGEVL